jgi:hypothetical protein
MPTGQNTCSRAVASPSRSTMSTRTASWPVGNVPAIEVRQIVFAAPGLKHSFFQSP